ncbi:AraC family transcriptional regulator [Limnochorda pilosa]|uniref:HTH araC/xylS-type domain-containing protein n=1 Tax=Limnochorda pilosa TaxID=1555112 RepID=A0A0K2SI57_LIMPI|nr:AraC family transcriptional regulator [Limnochorda pilosa]BAS26697.1 hypothetical protein LIP_0840 [Limnochorda pilosa]
MDSLRFSSRTIPARHRARAIQEFYAAIAGVRVDRRGETPLWVDSSLRRLPGVTMARTRCMPCEVRRLRSHIADANDDLVLCIVTRGSVTVRLAGGEEILCEAGDAYLGPNDLPAERIFHRPTAFLDLGIPRSLLRPLVARSNDAFAQQKLAPATSPQLRLLNSYVRVLARQHEPLHSEFAAVVAAHVRDLVAMVLGATREAAEHARMDGVRAARLRALKADVAANLTRGDLALEEVAARHRISPQYARALFHAEGTTFTDFLRSERLKHAYHRLADPRFAGWTISDIAFDSGFNDLSYFNRAFRRLYGMTPSQARASARAAVLETG